jgi:hypothetical protein
MMTEKFAWVAQLMQQQVKHMGRVLQTAYLRHGCV